LWFGAEDSLGNGSWNDRITGQPWTTKDFTADRVISMWHRDTFQAINGTYSMWWGDPEIGGYGSLLYEALLSPKLFIPADQDSLFLVYSHSIRCEESHGSGIVEGWDGYNVRIKTAGADTFYQEMAPYQVASDSSFYRHPPDPSNEWNILRCWEIHGEQNEPYGEPYDQWIGGFACDGTGQGGTETVVSKIFDLRPFAGDTIQVAFVGGSDWAYDTEDDTTLFGFIIDDVLVAEGLDSARLADLPAPLGGDTLFFDDFEGADPGWETYIPNFPTGDWWWLAQGDAHGGQYKAMCSDSITKEFIPFLDNFLVSPKIAHGDVDSNAALLDLKWYFKGQMASQEDECCVRNLYKLDDGPWEEIYYLTHPCGSYCYDLAGLSDAEWWDTDKFSNFLHDLTPLVTDTMFVWDSLQVAVGVNTNPGIDTTGTIGLQIDDIALLTWVAQEYDAGIYSLKIPGPNANDVPVTIDSVVIYNYGWHDIASGNYQVFMTVQDTTGLNVVDSIQVVDFDKAPNLPALTARMVPLDTGLATFTLIEEGRHQIKMWTDVSWPSYPAGDNDHWNDTLKTVYWDSSTIPPHQDTLFPFFDNYCAGQGELRYHDQGFYNYPVVDMMSMSSGQIAAVHFTPEERFCPFDLRRAVPQCADSNVTLNLKVYGSGATPDAAPLLATIPFNPSLTGAVELDGYPQLQHLCTDFWMGVEFPTAVGSIMGAEITENDWTHPGRWWSHSWLYDGSYWTYDYPGGAPIDDWLITAVISWRTVEPMAMPSLNGPPKNSSGNLHLRWNAVNQALRYDIFCDTVPSPDSADSCASAYDTCFTFIDAVGDTAVQHYYWIHTVHQDGIIYDKLSRGVGEFDRRLITLP
jgi:hypothetical protein